MLRPLVFSGPPQEPSFRWSASRNFTPRLMAVDISSGLGGVIGAGLGPSVASGELWGGFFGVGSVAVVSLLFPESAARARPVTMTAHVTMARQSADEVRVRVRMKLFVAKPQAMDERPWSAPRPAVAVL